MAVVIGTNAGFVETAPIDDPDAISAYTADTYGFVTHDTSPATAAKITEIGWWANEATQEANFEVGLYAADGAVVPGEAGTLLHSETTNAKGTTAGWKVVTGLNWSISSSIVYWLGVQLDNTSTTTRVDFGTGTGIDRITPLTSLPDPFGGGAIYNTGRTFAIYAVWEVAAEGTNIKINIGDVHKDVSEIKINIGDVWKNVVEVKQNIGGTWKTVF